MAIVIYDKLDKAWLWKYLNLEGSLPAIAKQIREKLKTKAWNTVVWKAKKFKLSTSLDDIDFNHDYVQLWPISCTYLDLFYILDGKLLKQKIPDQCMGKWFYSSKSSYYLWAPVRVMSVYEISKDYIYSIVTLSGSNNTLNQSMITKKQLTENEAERFVMRTEIEKRIANDKKKARIKKKKLLKSILDVEKILYTLRDDADIEEIVTKEINKMKVSEQDIIERYPFVSSYRESGDSKTICIKKWLPIKWKGEDKYITNCNYVIKFDWWDIVFTEGRHPHVAKWSWSVCKGWFNADFAQVLATWDKFLLIELLHTFITYCWVIDVGWGDNDIKNLVAEKIFLPIETTNDVKEKQPLKTD